MTERSILLRLKADAAQVSAAMRGLAKETRDVGKASQETTQVSVAAGTRLGKSAEDSSKAWDRTGQRVGRAGVVIAGALGLAGKASIDWESAWAGVTKTVDGSNAQMAELEGQLRGLTRTLPATHEEIAGVAEAAGQLGVKRKDLVGFTETMIGLGESTNLSADEAATAIAQISNVMGTMDREGTAGVQRFGSALVALGNDGASTERDIVSMAQRIAGAAKQVGASESDVLALANAMSSVGIEAQLGGGVISRVMLMINTQVLSSGKKLEEFARVSGMSASEFSAAWKADPVTALTSFVDGLARVSNSGGDAASTLSDLGIKGTENAQVMLRLTGANDMLKSSIKTGRDAWQENNALTAEASKRYETTASKIQLARNAAKDAAISFGDALAPSIESAAGVLSSLAQGFSSIPEPLQKVIAGGAALSVGIGGGVWGISKVLSAGKDLRVTLDSIADKSPRAGKGIDALGRTAAVAGKAMAALAVAGAGLKALEGGGGEFGIERINEQFAKGATSAEVFDEWIGKTRSSLMGLDSPVKDTATLMQYAFSPSVWSRMASGGDGFFRTISLGMVDLTSDADDVKRQMANLDGVLAQMVAGGNAKGAQDAFRVLATEAERYGGSADKLKALMPQYAEALAGASNQQRQAADTAKSAATGMDDLGQSQEDAAKKAQEAADEFQKLLDVIRGLDDQTSNARQTEADYQAALDAATASVKEHGKTATESKKAIDLHTEAGRANDAALRQIASTALDAAASITETGGSSEKAVGKVESAREAFVRQATQMGMTEAAANAYADQLGLIPENVRTMISNNASAAESEARSYGTYLRNINGTVVRTRVITEYQTIGGRAPGRSTHGGPLAEDGAIIEPRADGGFDNRGSYVPRVSQVARGGRYILWAEDPTIWEAYISGKPSMRGRNLHILQQAAARLGAHVIVPREGGGMHNGSSATASVAATGRELDPTRMAAIFGQQVRAALDGMAVRLEDGRTLGRLQSTYDLAYRR